VIQVINSDYKWKDSTHSTHSKHQEQQKLLRPGRSIHAARTQEFQQNQAKSGQRYGSGLHVAGTWTCITCQNFQIAPQNLHTKKKSSEFHLDETWIRRLCLNLTTLNSVRSVKKLLANPQNTGCFHEDSHGLWINPQYRKGNPSWMSTGSSRYCKLLMIRIYWDTKHYYIRKHSSIISP